MSTKIQKLRPKYSDCPECSIGNCHCGDPRHCTWNLVDEFGVCPIGHDGSYCQYCNQPKVHSKCPLLHDGTRCVHCKELNINGFCRLKHTGETCSVCNSLMSWFNGTAKCPKGHDGTYCTKCGTGNEEDLVGIICPQCRPGIRNIVFGTTFNQQKNNLPELSGLTIPAFKYQEL